MLTCHECQSQLEPGTQALTWLTCPDSQGNVEVRHLCMACDASAGQWRLGQWRWEWAEPRGLSAIVGKWPGDETDEEIRQALEELS